MRQFWKHYHPLVIALMIVLVPFGVWAEGEQFNLECSSDGKTVQHPNFNYEALNFNTDLDGCRSQFSEGGSLVAGKIRLDVELHVISYPVCVAQALFTHSMFDIYCNIVVNWVDTLFVMITLAVMLFGFSIMLQIGQQKDLRKAVPLLMKIVAVWGLATNPDLFAFYIFDSFFSFVDSFTHLMINTTLSQAALGEAGASGGVSIFNRMDKIFIALVGGIDRLQNLSFYAIALFVVPAIGPLMAIMIASTVVATLVSFVNLIISYLVLLVSLSFVMLFAPIFLSALLFKQTEPFFERWIASIVSRALQVVLNLMFIFMLAKIADASEITNDNVIITVGNDKTISLLDKKIEIQGRDFIIPTEDGGFADFYSPTDDSRMDYLYLIIGAMVSWIYANLLVSSVMRNVGKVSKALGRFKNVRAIEEIHQRRKSYSGQTEGRSDITAGQTGQFQGMSPVAGAADWGRVLKNLLDPRPGRR